ncbi:MAG TPA: sugar phosphate isomerase/epimerase family protein [Bacteroidales bacterium]|nr:sugar phosphate isomerase/epimerase family protein [Bacteroidales bacterium]
MDKKYTRKDFTRNIAIAGMVSAFRPEFSEIEKNSAFSQASKGNLKLSLNAYSFNGPLSQGAMSLDDLLDYCSATGFDGVDITGYYFPGYPAVPSDEVIYHVKRKAFRLGLGISGTGVRNDFTWGDPAKRADEKKLVREWIIVAEKLGAALLRIFAGNQLNDNVLWERKATWVAEDIRECAEFGKAHGVMLALQNHYDFLKTPGEVEQLLKLTGSDWTGLLLDIGSYRSADPYKDVGQTAKYAISWQLKEKMYVNEKQIDTDYSKIIGIVRGCGYKGYLPLETLGEGDPKIKVELLLRKVQDALYV